ncbi:MAG: undecaprenyl-diphosphatase UppP [Bdellovibrionales bacterium]|jgi:undecaprenyl-diphosphatase|nr:undecaprenyl-diphosphatase UppP [Bdellovibrionales bacterium]
MEFWQALILAVIEGITEYLPISSTGHIILGSALMGIEGNDFVKDYTVIVQLGAILSVLVVYRDRIWSAMKQGPRVYLLMLLAFLPAAFFGLLFGNQIDAMLGDVKVVGWSLLIGGFVLLFLDRLAKKIENPSLESDALKLSFKNGILIGFAQCLALVPGVSRSGASIAGGLAMGFSRKTAAEFSFFLGVPTLAAACGYKLLKMGESLSSETLPIIIVGNLVSFAVGCLAIKSFIGFLQRRGFFWFGVYRIILGALILAVLFSGHDLQMVD